MTHCKLMPDRARLTATIYGRVQGVYFRGFVYDHAVDRSLVGYARNLPGGTSVEVKVEGRVEALNELLELLKQGPPASGVERVVADWGSATGEFDGFEIR